MLIRVINRIWQLKDQLKFLDFQLVCDTSLYKRVST